MFSVFISSPSFDINVVESKSLAIKNFSLPAFTTYNVFLGVSFIESVTLNVDVLNPVLKLEYVILYVNIAKNIIPVIAIM